MTPGGAPRRFTASAPRWRRFGLVVGLGMLAWLALLVATLAAVGALLDAKVARDATGGVLLVYVLAYGGFLAYVFKPQPLLVDVWPDRVVLDEGRRGVFPAAAALLGVWQLPTYGVAAGTALHLSDGVHRFCLGGRDHRPPPSLRLGAPPVESVDAYVTAPELDAILGAMPSVAPPAVQLAAAATVVRCILTPNRASARGILSTMLPWGLTMVALAIVSVLAASLGLAESAAGQIATVVVLVAVIITGLAVTVVRSMRRPTPALVVQLEAEGLRVLDAKTGAPLAAARYLHVQALPAKHTYAGRAPYTMPMLLLLVPGARAISFGIPDYRFSWRGDPRREAAPAYVVGGADWLALVDRFGLRDRLEVGPG